MSSKHVLLEVCVDSVADAIAAAEAGADRIELCSALSLGGLTPSGGTIAEVKAAIEIPVLVMIRPRESGFCYADWEFVTMCRDAELAIDMGADGIVFGIVDTEGNVDQQQCRRLRGLARDRETVFHRAFDIVRDPFSALKALIDLGFTRILTSGQARTAPEGAERISRLVEQSAGRIEILSGGGLNEHNVAEFVRRTGCTQVHMGLSMPREDPSIPADTPIRFGSPPANTERSFRSLDPQRVRMVIERLGYTA